jgi:hypothetical protein
LNCSLLSLYGNTGTALYDLCVEKLELLCPLPVWKHWNCSLHSPCGNTGTALYSPCMETLELLPALPVWKHWNCSVLSLCGNTGTALCTPCVETLELLCAPTMEAKQYKSHSASSGAVSAAGYFPRNKAAGTRI